MRWKGWAVILLYPTMLLFTIFNWQAGIFSRELAGSSGASSSAASHHNVSLDGSYFSKEYSSSGKVEFQKDRLSYQLEIKARRLLSHVLAVISFWYAPDEKEVKFLGHTLGTIREWRLLPEIGNVTVVIITNDAKAAKESLGRRNADWYEFHQVNTSGKPYHMPFYHREVVADYLDRGKDETNMTVMPNEDLPPPSAYSFFEADNVLDGAGLIAWARDTALLQAEGGEADRIRHFWRWEWNALKGCAAFTGQIKTIPRNRSRIITIHGKEFVSMIGTGVWAGMYVVTAQHMLEYYNSGLFWNLPKKYKYSREIQLHDIVHGNDEGRPDKNSGDNTIVPIDKRTGTVHLSAGVHHQSDKYQKKQNNKFSSLCVNDLFT